MALRRPKAYPIVADASLCLAREREHRDKGERIVRDGVDTGLQNRRVAAEELANDRDFQRAACFRDEMRFELAALTSERHQHVSRRVRFPAAVDKRISARFACAKS